MADLQDSEQLSDKSVDSGMGGGLLGAELGTTGKGLKGFFDEEEDNSCEEDGESEECQVSVGRPTIANMQHQNQEARRNNDDNIFEVASASYSKENFQEGQGNNVINQTESKASDQGS